MCSLKVTSLPSKLLFFCFFFFGVLGNTWVFDSPFSYHSILWKSWQVSGIIFLCQRRKRLTILSQRNSASGNLFWRQNSLLLAFSIWKVWPELSNNYGGQRRVSRFVIRMSIGSFLCLIIRVTLTESFKINHGVLTSTW